MQSAALLLSAYWTSVFLDRLLALPILRKLPVPRVLKGAACGTILLLAIAAWNHGTIAGTALLLTGIFNAVIFPSIFTLCLSGLEETRVPAVSSMLTMALVGGAILPLCSGALADRVSIRLEPPRSELMDRAPGKSLEATDGLFDPYFQ